LRVRGPKKERRGVENVVREPGGKVGGDRGKTGKVVNVRGGSRYIK